MSPNTQYYPSFLRQARLQRGLVLGAIILAALLAFEIFNYSTTEFALTDLLGELRFAGIRWATILSIAFCGIDFAGIARLFTPNSGQYGSGHNETWYLFGAWMLAATMNAMLTWWGVSLAVINHQTLGNAFIGREVIVRAVPIFVALMVWLIRVLIIGTFSVAGQQLFFLEDGRNAYTTRIPLKPGLPNSANAGRGRPQPKPSSIAATPSYRPAPQNQRSFLPDEAYESRMEPTYHPLSASPASIDVLTGGMQPASNKPVRRF
jgi:hypothetical protein